MSTVNYTGNELNQKRRDVYVVAAPASGLSTYTVTVNGKQFSYVAESAVAADVAAALVNAYNAAVDIRELADAPATVSGATTTFESKLAGMPFGNTYGVSGGGTWNGSTTISNSGSGQFNAADNWSAAIIAGDDLALKKPNQNIGYDLSLATSIASFTMYGTFNGELGLPITNPSGYPEYRGCYATIICPLVVIGLGDGPGPSRAYIETNAGAATVATIYKTGSSTDAYPAVMLKHTAGGGNSFSSVRVVSGSVGIALLPGEASTVTTLNIGGQDQSPSVQCGPGVALTTLNIESGQLQLVTSPSGTSTITGGAVVNISNGGAASALNIDNGTCFLGGSGAAFTITDITVGESGVLDLSGGQGAVTVTNGIQVYTGAVINDPLDRLVANTVFKPQNCKMNEFTYNGKPGKNWTKN